MYRFPQQDCESVIHADASNKLEGPPRCRTTFMRLEHTDLASPPVMRSPYLSRNDYIDYPPKPSIGV